VVNEASVRAVMAQSLWDERRAFCDEIACAGGAVHPIIKRACPKSLGARRHESDSSRHHENVFS